MKNAILVATFTTLLPAFCFSQEQDLTDLSRYELFQEGDEVLTLNSLEANEDKYLSLVAEGKCVEALPLIVGFATDANKLSNLIRRGSEPYYDARRDDQEDIARNRTLLNKLIVAETTFNNLLERRNKAWVEEAKCLIEQGDTEAGITRLYRALDYINHGETALWEEARILLWAQVGLNLDQ